MYVNGNLDIAGVVSDLKLERLATDPGSPALSRVWFNSADKKIKYFDGENIIALAAGGSLDNYLALTGGTLTGALTLAGAGTEDLHAVTVKQLTDGLATKQATITGAASTLVTEDLEENIVVITDSQGKIVASTIGAGELALLGGITGNVQEQLDGKQATIGYVPLNKAGDSVNGNLTFGGTATVKNLTKPVDGSDAVRLSDLEEALLGLDFQADVVGFETDYTEGTAGRYIFVDGSLLVEGEFVPAAGDIVNVNEEGEITSIDYDISEAGVNGALAWNAAAGTWVSLKEGTWGAFGGLSGVTAGVGLSKVGNTISVRLGAGIADLPNGEVGVELGENSGLALVDPESGEESTDAESVLRVKTGAALETTGTGLNIKNDGVTEFHLNESVAGDGLVGGGGVPLAVSGGDGITVTADGIELDLTFGDSRYLTLVGGTLTGELILAGDATNALSPVTKQQFESGLTAVGGDTTDLATRLNSGVFVYEEVTTAAVSHTVTHNLGNKYGTVVVTDENDEVVIPQSITFNTANSLTVTFAGASLCRVIVSGVKAAA